MFLLPCCTGKVLPTLSSRSWDAARGMRRMGRIRRSGDNHSFVDPPTEFNA